MTIASINKDLEKIQQRYGSTFIRVLCASIIMEHCDWNWDNLKAAFITDPDMKLLLCQESLQEKTLEKK